MTTSIRKKSALTAIFSATLLVAGAVVSSTPAVAAEPLSQETTVGSVNVSVEALKPGQSETVQVDSETTMTLEVGEAELVDVAAIKNDPNLSTVQRAEILDAAPRAAVRSAQWSQFTTGGSYTQTQNGTFYWNGSKVWVTSSYAGYAGSHSCFTNYAITGWAIHGTNTSDTGGNASRNLYCGWNVTQPMWFTHYVSMTAIVYSNGTISGFGATTS